VPILSFLIFLFSCQNTATEEFFLPDILPTEEEVKYSLSSDEYLVRLRAIAKSKQLTLEEWKEGERAKVKESEISRYWQAERKKLPLEISNTDAIDRMRDSIRIRIVWSRIFHEAGLSWKVIPSKVGNLLSKLDIKHSPKIGNPKGKWVIIEWSDFLCHFCKQTFPFTKKLLLKRADQIYYIHKDFPLDDESEEGILPLAMARCLWENEPTNILNHMDILYSDSKKIKSGTDLGFKNCSADDLNSRFKDLVRVDHKEAQKLGVTSIPTFWVNGRWIVGSLNQETWEKVLRETERR